MLQHLTQEALVIEGPYNKPNQKVGNFTASPGQFFDPDRVSKGFNNIELNLNNLFSRVQHVVSVLHWLKTSKAVMCPT